MATFDELQIPVRLHGPRAQKVKCPVCNPQRKDKSDKSLSVDLSTGMFNCHYCAWKGKATEKSDADYALERKQYAKPTPIELPLSVRAINWFVNDRGISRETLQYFRVSESQDWMPDRGTTKAGTRTCINFNYYRDGQKVNVKYRDALKCFRMTKDAELILYNQDALRERTDMLICEGEIDCMSFYQAGHFGAVSVPNGASKGSAKLEYLDNCADVFARMDKIIIAVDGDEAGTFLKNELVRRLGKHRCWFIEYPEGCKDANEVMLKHGIDALRKMWQSAVCPPMEAVLTVDDLTPQLYHIYENGWPQREPIGYDEFDNLLNFEGGQLTMVTGIPGHGKDEFITQVLTRKAARYGEACGIFNYEEPAHIQTIKIAQKYIGLPFHRHTGDRMNIAQRDAALKFVSRNFFFIDIAKADLTIDGILTKGRELVLRKNIKHFVIGPYNCLENSRADNQTEGEYISEVMRKVKRFALETGVHVFLVAHPTKMRKDNDGNFLIPSLYDIAGSANFFNKTDNGVCIYRNYKDNTAEVYVQKVKFFYNGKVGYTSLKFDVHTGRYQEHGLDYESELRLPQQTQIELTEPAPPIPATIAPVVTTSPVSASVALPASVKADLTKWGVPVPIPEEEVPF